MQYVLIIKIVFLKAHLWGFQKNNFGAGTTVDFIIRIAVFGTAYLKVLQSNTFK
jgi:hypothetical protein